MRATCDLKLRTANSIKPDGAANAGFFVICYVLLGSDGKTKRRSESEILWRETPSCSMDGAGARRTWTEVAYLTGSESEQSKGAPRS